MDVELSAERRSEMNRAYEESVHKHELDLQSERTLNDGIVTKLTKELAVDGMIPNPANLYFYIRTHARSDAAVSVQTVGESPLSLLTDSLATRNLNFTEVSGESISAVLIAEGYIHMTDMASSLLQN